MISFRTLYVENGHRGAAGPSSPARPKKIEEGDVGDGEGEEKEEERNMNWNEMFMQFEYG